MSAQVGADHLKKNTLFQSATLGALGIVFGDLGTSPLYAVREAFHGPHAITPSPENILGVLSLILWTLVMVICVKYVSFVMRADNKGEGGVLSLISLAFPSRLANKNRSVKALLYLGLFGAALLVGDGVITPAISVLSAVEGLEVATPFFEPFILPITLAILATLFLNQHHGTAKIGSIFGVIVFIWFLSLAALGIHGIVIHPAVLMAVNPLNAFRFFLHNGYHGVLVLGAVFLVTTGAEALCADMGHFGKQPIKRAWFFIVFPGLILNYLGQGGLLLYAPEKAFNPFYALAPGWAVYPMVAIATLATVTASQAVISGVFSLARQAVQLGYCPRVRIIHTSKEAIGQIYIPQVNWALLIMTFWLVLEFRSSSALAAAYGIAVSATMVVTTLLSVSVAKNRWKWKSLWWGSILVLFLTIDSVFLWANLTKIADGGWFPLLVGAVVFTLMTTWHRGRQILRARLKEKSIPFEEFLAQLKAKETAPTCVEGTAVFMTGEDSGTPPALIHNVKHNRVLHSLNVLMTIQTEDAPTVPLDERLRIQKVGERFYRVVARYGFSESPSIHEILATCRLKNLPLELEDMTFFLGRETLLATKRPGMALWREKLFSFMSKNSERATAYFDIPPDQVVEMGLQVEL